MTICKISPRLRGFFDVEERNAKSMMGELEPSVQTLTTAFDSLQQAPTDVIIEWFGFSTTRAAQDVIPYLLEMMQLVIMYGGEIPLSEFA